MPRRARLFTVFCLLLVSFPAVAEQVVIQHGEATRYAKKLAGHKTASGELHDPKKMTAASRTLPLGSKATVTNKQTGKSVDVRINDRGPFGHSKRVIDLSPAAAQKLGLGPQTGTASVKVEAKASAQPTKALRKEIEHRANVQ
jgi:rare lipoprotein A